MKAIHINDGTLEALKWLALFFMALDHINKYFFREHYAFIFDAGRVCMPLFAFILAYNLARTGTLENGRYVRVLIKLALFGLLAMPAYWFLGVPFFVLNIMFMLAVGVLCIWLLDEGGPLNSALAVVGFLVMSAFVEYWWWGVSIMILSWYFCRNPSAILAIAIVGVVAALALINRNLYALAAIPIFYGTQYIKFSVPRLRHVFYVFYPVHLTAILLIKNYVI